MSWLAVVLLLVALAAFAAAGVSSSACGSCHAMRPFAVSLRSSAHASVGCYRCHAPAAGSYTALVSRVAGGMLPRTLLTLNRGTVSGATDPSPDAGCRDCHAAVLAGGTVAVRGIRIRHSICVPPGQPCRDCHNTVAHGAATRAGRSFTMDGCVRCHDGESAASACDLCHAAKLPSDRLVRGPWTVTHGKDWQRTHGLGDLQTCKACHTPDKCRKCHKIELPHPESFPRTHGKAALKVEAECVKCHDEKAFCTRCHGMRMPHPEGFLPRHSKIASGFADPACAHCHDRTSCDGCHTAHTHPGRTDGTLGKITLPKAATP